MVGHGIEDFFRKVTRELNVHQTTFCNKDDARVRKSWAARFSIMPIIKRSSEHSQSNEHKCSVSHDGKWQVANRKYVAEK